MNKKTKKNKTFRPQPKPNRQIPNSLIRNFNPLVSNHCLQNAREHPLYGCWIMTGWQEAGISPVVVAREQEPGKIMFGVYMVDLYCLGVKDAFTKVDYSTKRFKRDLHLFCADAPQECSVELAHEVIYGGLEYAEKLGFQPHPDFKEQMADLMLDLSEDHPRIDNVVFGKEGKPFYVSGPFDDENKIRSIINTLMRTSGEGNFHYLINTNEMAD